MIRTSHDEALFDYYFNSQLATIDTTTGRRTVIGIPAIFATVTPAPDDRFILISRVKRPYSHLIPMDGFPQQVEIWNRRGEKVRAVADIPSREGVTLTGVRTGPREYRWRPDQPATLIWVEALDEGDLKNKVPFRDTLYRTLKNRPFRILLCTMLAYSTATAMVSVLGYYTTVYYVCRGDVALAGQWNSAMGVAGMVFGLAGIPFFGAIAKRKGKREALMAVLVGAIAAFIGDWWFYNPAFPALQLLACGFVAFTGAGFWTI